MSSGQITLPHICPKCKIEIAIDYQELEKKFGFRNIDQASMRNQSWCRECRKKSTKK